MRQLINPTSYFIHQQHSFNQIQQINQYSSNLLNRKKCILCLSQYDLTLKMPRIIVACGHTFCSLCLNSFFKNQRILCPLCLKKMKHIKNVEFLPINHTIYSQMRNSCSNTSMQKIQAQLYTQFDYYSKQRLRTDSIKIDESSQLPFCPFHKANIQCYFCVTHGAGICRSCIEQSHNIPFCKVVDIRKVLKQMK